MYLPSKSLWSSVAIIPTLLLLHTLLKKRRTRTSRVSPSTERVLILGASSGIGKEIALKYARRGARLCIVARRKEVLASVLQECQTNGCSASAIAVAADFSNVDDLVSIRDTIEREWQGLDTLVVCAGVSALQPLLRVAGSTKDSPQTTAAGIKRTGEVALAALAGNYLGPLLSAVTFIPMLESTSLSPSICQISSIASIIPAPTRSLYGSTKAASFILYRSLSIEHPRIGFSIVCPATVEGDFRGSAVDFGDVRESLKGALKAEFVARECVKAVDDGTKLVLLPRVYWLINLISWILPSVVERGASKKYGFQTQRSCKRVNNS